MATTPERTRRWTRVEYDRLIDLGIFRPGEHLELLGGHLVVGDPQSSLHATGAGLVADTLRACFGSGWAVRTRMPIALDDESEPEPDVAVVPGTHRDYEAAHPTRPALLIEVAESSLAADRGTKAALYARAGIADYWILNLVDRALEVCHDPVTVATTHSAGWRYRDIAVLHAGASIAPLARPGVPVEVAALLPRSGYYAR
jgi:Uma2 family endonuclease